MHKSLNLQTHNLLIYSYIFIHSKSIRLQRSNPRRRSRSPNPPLHNTQLQTPISNRIHTDQRQSSHSRFVIASHWIRRNGYDCDQSQDCSRGEYSVEWIVQEWWNVLHSVRGHGIPKNHLLSRPPGQHGSLLLRPNRSLQFPPRPPGQRKPPFLRSRRHRSPLRHVERSIPQTVVPILHSRGQIGLYQGYLHHSSFGEGGSLGDILGAGKCEQIAICHDFFD